MSDQIEDFVPESLRGHQKPRLRPLAKKRRGLFSNLLTVSVWLILIGIFGFAALQSVDHWWEAVGVVLLLVFGLVVYFAPTLIASSRDHRNVAAIAVINLLLGWTLLGWVVALAWALYVEAPKR